MRKSRSNSVRIFDECQKESRGRAKQEAHHCNTSTRSILLRRTCRKVQVDIDRFWNLQRILRAQIRNAQVISIVLDPAQCQLSTLLDHLIQANHIRIINKR